MAAAIEAGTVWVNRQGRDEHRQAALRQVQASGLGREGGLEGLDTYTRVKTVRIAL